MPEPFDLEPPPLVERSFLRDGIYVRLCEPAGWAARTRRRPTLLFVHGSCHGAFAWSRWQPAFAARGWPTAALSQRNHHGSAEMDEAAYQALDIFAYVADVERVAEAIDGPVVLIGHSMGGIVVQKAAEEMSRVGRAPAALVPVASIGPEALGPQRKTPLDTDRPYLPSREEARERWFFEPVEDDWFEQFYAMLRPESTGVLVWSGFGRTPVDPALITCPVLCVGGAEDRSWVPPAETLAALYGGDAITIPKTGHNMMFESASMDIVQRIDAWLGERLIADHGG